MVTILDPKPSEYTLRTQYLSWDQDRGLCLTTCTGDKYWFTRLETFLVKYNLLSVKSFDRYFTRLARFEARKRKMYRKIEHGVDLKPRFDKDPKTLKPVLFTTKGTEYRLTYIDRLMLKFCKTNIERLNKKAILHDR